MKFDWIDPDRGPTPEQLGAYADGELGDAGREAIDAWLRCHPAQADEVDSLRRLTQLYRDVPLPAPSPDAWSTVRVGIEKGLHPQPTLAARSRWSLARLGLIVAAAAVLVVIFLSKGHWSVATAEEPYPVVEPEDVAILSIDGEDCKCLVGAQPPVGRIDECDLATPDDVLVLNLEEHADRTVAEQRYEDNGPLMITPPAGWERER